MGQVIQKFENNQFLQVIQSYKETQATKAIHLLQDTQKDEVIYGIQDTQTSKVIHKIIKPMTAEQYLFLNSVCLTLQCERKNKETVFDGNIPSKYGRLPRLSFKHTTNVCLMIAIVATYFQRQVQLEKTLASFCQYKDEDFVFIVVDDGSPEEIRLPEVPFSVEVVRVKNKTWRNTCVPFNLGFIQALKYDPDIVIIQNVECLHSGDILTAARKVTDETVLSFACYSLGHGEEPGITLNNKAAEFNDESSWYNHSVYRPFGFHFCNAMTAANLRKLNGMDERLWEGIAYEDNMFKHQIQNLGLRFEFIDDPFVYHQWHDRPYEITEELVNRNYITFIELQKINEYRAVHVLTPDLS